jgi:septal ring factor EnvC (AmiA/AmiB activator)
MGSIDDAVVKILVVLLTGGYLVEIIKGLFQKRAVKSAAQLNDANATQVIVASTTTLLKPLQDRIQELEAELVEARQEAKKMVKEMKQVTAENTRLTSENMAINAENRRLRLKLGEVP